MYILFLHFIVYSGRTRRQLATERELDFLEGPFDLSYFRKVDNALILRRDREREASREGGREKGEIEGERRVRESRETLPVSSAAGSKSRV